VRDIARRHLAEADVAIATSYCPDALAAEALMRETDRPLRVFYDLDTGVTLTRLAEGVPVPYIGGDGLTGYDLVLSYTGGGALPLLRSQLGAQRVVPLYGSVDPAVHCPAAPAAWLGADVSYLGTWAADRQAALEALFIEPARRLPDRRFLIGGAQYPAGFPWADNIWFVQHVPPADHPAFYCSSRLTVNVTRAPMAAFGWCPSGRLFEAAACGVPVVSDWWPGLDEFFTPGEEILVARDTAEAIAAYTAPADELARIGRAARERALADHSADRRAAELEAALEAALAPLAPEP
jgi:spore maturation protein CgeB